MGRRFDWGPGAIARFRPRPGPRAFFAQYFRYARGDGKALLWTRRHLIRYLTYLGAPLVIWRTRAHPVALLATVLAGCAYCSRPFQRLRPELDQLPTGDRLTALALIPLIRLIGDLAKMLGYPVGLLWRWQHRRPELID
jgi:hypothetical protein